MRILTWVLSALIAISFLAAAFFKLTSAPIEIQAFNLFGYPLWFMYVIGVVEIACAIGIFIPRYATIAAAVAACNMLGALISHLTHGQTAAAAVPFVIMVMAISVVFLRGGVRQLASLKAG